MPGRKWYAIALLLFIVGVTAAGLVVYARMSALTTELPQVIVPGQAALTITQPGTYTIYLERNAVVNGRLYAASDDIAGLRVRLASPSGAPIDLTPPSVRSNYSLGGRAGTAVLTSTISEPGRYQLTAAYPDGRSGPEGVLAIGLNVPRKIVTTVLLALTLGAAGFAIAVSVAGVTFFKRRKAARARVVADSLSHATS